MPLLLNSVYGLTA